MPFLEMKSKISNDSSTGKRVLGVCKRSQTVEKCTPKYHDGQQLHLASSSLEAAAQDFETSEMTDVLVEDNSWSQQQASNFDGTKCIERMGFIHFASDLKTIFSPAPEPFKLYDELDAGTDPGSINNLNMSIWEADETDYNGISFDNQTWNASDFLISDMLIASLPFDENALENVFAEISPLPDYMFPEPSMIFDVAEQYMRLPFLEDKSCNSETAKSDEGKMVDLDNHDLYLAIDPMETCNMESGFNTTSDETDDFDPQSFIKNQPGLSDVVSNFLPDVLPKESRTGKPVTLILDLDETLVHSTLEHRDDADFSFTIFFDMEVHTVFVKQRPHLYRFLESVAELFRVVIFTASRSIYASQLLDILDPDGRFISGRFYRESCILSDGIYTKDLTVLGLDLAKVVIIDNCPQVFRLQVNNGIPIKSWYDDPSDDGLISLLPFLETLAGADDVRPIIAKRFGNKE